MTRRDLGLAVRISERHSVTPKFFWLSPGPKGHTRKEKIRSVRCGAEQRQTEALKNMNGFFVVRFSDHTSPTRNLKDESSTDAQAAEASFAHREHTNHLSLTGSPHHYDFDFLSPIRSPMK